MSYNKYASVYFNNENYYDGTAGQAIINVIKAEKQSNRKPYETAKKKITAYHNEKKKNPNSKVIDPILKFAKEYTSLYNSTHKRTSKDPKKANKPLKCGTIRYVYAYIQMYQYCLEHCEEESFTLNVVSEKFGFCERKVKHCFTKRGDIGKVINAWNKWNTDYSAQSQ